MLRQRPAPRSWTAPGHGGIEDSMGVPAAKQQLKLARVWCEIVSWIQANQELLPEGEETLSSFEARH